MNHNINLGTSAMKPFKYLAGLALAISALAAVAAGITYADRSGTITTGGTSQTLAAANPTRGRIAITNPPTETERLCVNVTSAASCTTPGSWLLSPGETIVLDSSEAITVVAATTGHKYTAKENITEGFAINVSGSTSISGGAGDASASNQTSGAQKTQIVDGSGNVIGATSNALDVNIKSGGGSGGTSSTVGSATPSTATAAGGSDGTNLQIPRVVDVDSGAGSQYALVVTPRLSASGGAIEFTAGAGAVAAGTLRTTQASDSPAVTVLGATGDSAATQGSTGSISAKLRTVTSQLNTISGALTLAQGSTTSGQTGNLVQAAVTTSAPTYTTGQTSPLSLDTTGALRVNVTAGGAGGGNVTGGTAHDAVGTSVNPVLVGGYASAAAPTNVSADGDAVRAWMLRSGAQAVQPTLGGVLASAGSGSNGTGVQRVTIATDDTLVASLGTKLDTLHTDVTATNTQLPTALGQTTMSGSLSTTVASNQAAVALWGHGATGSAVPANATMAGGRSGANLVSFPVSDTTAPISMSTATTTQFIALSGSTKTYIDNLSIMAAGTTNVTIVQGTGTNCGTGTTSLTGAMPLVANSGFVLQRIVVPAGKALCVTSSAAVQVSGHVTYTQY